MVAAEQRDQILQSTRVMYIAVKDLVEQGKAFLLGHPQADLFHLDIGDGSGEHGAAIGLFADIANEALDHLSLYAAVLDLGEVDFGAFFNLPNKAHVVVTITTTRRKASFF